MAQAAPTPLFEAVEAGDEAAVERLLSIAKGRRVTRRQMQNQQAAVSGLEQRCGAANDTPLIMAARHGHAGIVRLLLAAGANSEALAHNGWTPLLRASYGGHTTTVAALVAVPTVNKLAHTRNKHMTALMLACTRGHLGVVHALLAAGDIGLNTTGHGGWAALHYAAAKNNADAVRALLAAGATLDLRIDACETAMTLAAGHNSCNALQVRHA